MFRQIVAGKIDEKFCMIKLYCYNLTMQDFSSNIYGKDCLQVVFRQIVLTNFLWESGQ